MNNRKFVPGDYVFGKLGNIQPETGLVVNTFEGGADVLTLDGLGRFDIENTCLKAELEFDLNYFNSKVKNEWLEEANKRIKAYNDLISLFNNKGLTI